MEKDVQPTKHNPFMNVRFTDYKIDPERPKACDISLPKVQEKIEDNFSHNLYQDVSDVFGRNVASEQFYTIQQQLFQTIKKLSLNGAMEIWLVVKIRIHHGNV